MSSNPCCYLSRLPTELKCRAVSYLSPTDACAFTEHFSTPIGVHVTTLAPALPFVAQIEYPGLYANGDTPVIVETPLPVWNSGHVKLHSVTLDLSWKDQGWGNHKGELFLVAHADGAEPDPSARFRGGRLVWATDHAAPHQLEALRVTFCPREDETYCIWYKAGGGGGHTLLIQNLAVSMTIFDDEEWNWKRMFHRMTDLNVVSVEVSAVARGEDPAPECIFLRKMLYTCCRCLRRQIPAHETPDPDMVDFLTANGIPMADGALRAIQEIVRCDMAAREKESAAWSERGPSTGLARGHVLRGGVFAFAGPANMQRFNLFGQMGMDGEPDMDAMANAMGADGEPGMNAIANAVEGLIANADQIGVDGAPAMNAFANAIGGLVENAAAGAQGMAENIQQPAAAGLQREGQQPGFRQPGIFINRGATPNMAHIMGRDMTALLQRLGQGRGAAGGVDPDGDHVPNQDDIDPQPPQFGQVRGAGGVDPDGADVPDLDDIDPQR
jgi:hypothetical protein